MQIFNVLDFISPRPGCYSNVRKNNKNILPFDVDFIFVDGCVKYKGNWNLFNLDKNNYVSPIWFHWMGAPNFMSFKIDNVTYISKEMVYEVRLNNKYNFITYDGEYLFNKWLEFDKKCTYNGVLILKKNIQFKQDLVNINYK